MKHYLPAVNLPDASKPTSDSDQTHLEAAYQYVEI